MHPQVMQALPHPNGTDNSNGQPSKQFACNSNMPSVILHRRDAAINSCQWPHTLYMHDASIACVPHKHDLVALYLCARLRCGCAKAYLQKAVALAPESESGHQRAAAAVATAMRARSGASHSNHSNTDWLALAPPVQRRCHEQARQKVYSMSTPLIPKVCFAQPI